MDVSIIMIGTILVWGAVCGLFAGLERGYQKRKAEKARLRELHAEVCRLRVALERQENKSEYKLDALRTELAIKELLLRQKWAVASKVVGGK